MADSTLTNFRVTVQENASVYSTPLSINVNAFSFPNPQFDTNFAGTTTITTSSTNNAYSPSVIMYRLQFSPTVTAAQVSLAGGLNYALLVDDASDFSAYYAAYTTSNAGLTLSTAGNGQLLGFLQSCTSAPLPLTGCVPAGGTTTYYIYTQQANTAGGSFATAYVPTTLSCTFLTW